MAKGKTYIIVGLIFILAFFAGNLVYPQFLNLPFIPDQYKEFKLGLDLQGGIHLIYETNFEDTTDKDYNSLMQGLKDVIERRINYFGVSEPEIRIQEAGDQYRLIVELPGVTDPEEAINEIGRTPSLDFRQLRSEEDLQRIEDKQKELEGLTTEEIYQVENWEWAYEDVFELTALTGEYLIDARSDSDPSTLKNIVTIEFNEEGKGIFEELTRKNLGKQLAIYVDGEMVSAPRVNDVIAGGTAQITGDFTIEEAKELARNLQAGALPIPISLFSQQSVGPTLGADSLQKSLRAGFFGFLLIIIFMLLFYRGLGFISFFSLSIYILLTLALFKIISATLTLAGIGGLILSVGMAIDANILIFSRIREEMKLGISFSQAIESGFNRAWPSIRDGNVTTLIVALILFVFGTSFIKGFALTLSIGILISMFSAFFITKNFLRIVAFEKLEKIKKLWQ